MAKRTTQALVAVGIIGAFALLLATRKRKPAPPAEDEEAQDVGEQLSGQYRRWYFVIRPVERKTKLPGVQKLIWGTWISEHIKLNGIVTDNLPPQFYVGFGKTKDDAIGVMRKAVDERVPAGLKEDLLPS